jgi:cytochrome c-type biogenesis protein CcmE
MRSRATLVGLTVAAFLAGIAIWAFSSTVVPYTHDFSEAKNGKAIQVYAKIDKNSLGDDSFRVIDEKGETMTVKALKGVPQNIGHADYCVVSGRYDNEKNVFEAESVLVKCPSKYEELGKENSDER